jgi:predicted MFS family arabinose efflux permease
VTDAAVALNVERRLIMLLALGAFGSAASLRVADAQLPALATVFGVSLSAAAQVITVFSVAYGVLQLASGPIGDRLGKWRVIAATVMIAACGSAACALAPNFPALLLARALTGAACAGVIPLCMAWIGDAVPYERRQPVLARFLTGQILGMALGQWLGGVAADLALWRAPFVVLTVWFALASVLLWRTRGAANAFAPPQPRSGHPYREIAYVLSQRWARVILTVVFIEGMVLFGPLAFLATHLHLAYGVSLSAAGTIATFYAVGGLGFAISSKHLVPRLGEVGLPRGGAVLMLAGLLAVSLSPVWWTAPFACALAGLGFYMLHNTLQTNATQMAPDARGAAVSLFASSFFIGQTVGVALVSLIIEEVGAGRVLATSGVLVLVLGWMFSRLRAAHHAGAAPG